VTGLLAGGCMSARLLIAWVAESGGSRRFATLRAGVTVADAGWDIVDEWE
jgi:hypothetical protein